MGREGKGNKRTVLEVATVPVVELVVPPGFPTSPALVRAFFIFVNIDGIFDFAVYACCD